jgi:hypothetical protein
MLRNPTDLDPGLPYRYRKSGLPKKPRNNRVNRVGVRMPAPKAKIQLQSLVIVGRDSRARRKKTRMSCSFVQPEKRKRPLATLRARQ